ncbi:MAG: MlaD family protein [Pseudanabaenaceae cyanobacterium]
MPDRSLRDKILGLFLLVGIALTGGLIYWLRGGIFGEVGFSFMVRFPKAGGINVGSTVRFRGVPVGRVKSISPESNVVKVEVAIDNPKLAIPKDSTVETIQSSLLGNTEIEIFPRAVLPEAEYDPLSPNCDNNAIICRGQEVSGQIGVSFTELLRESGRFFRQANEAELVAELKTTLKNAGEAAANISKLTGAFNRLLNTVDREITRFGSTAEAIASAADNVGTAARNADQLIQDSRTKLADTLDRISAAAKEAEELISSVRPLLQEGTLISDLRQLAKDAAQTATNLRQITGEFSDPATLNTLRETIESARVTFANAQKITTDLDELTGDPRFRQNIRNLIQGLSGLISDSPMPPPPRPKEQE